MSWLLSFFAALLIFLILKFFFFDIVRMNSSCMEASYAYGDAMLLNKWSGSYKNNDVVYFELPPKDSVSSSLFFIQRICAGPGDSLEIRGKEIYVNNKKDTFTIQALKHNYFIRSKKTKLDSAFKAKYHLTEGGELSDEFDYSYSLTFAESELLKKDSLITDIELKTEKAGQPDENCFPYSANYLWNMDHYGKIYIPKKNDVLLLDTTNINLYSVIIEDYEHKALAVRADSIFIDGHPVYKYIVEQDYYFVLGDNRSNANDSRSWGYLPAKSIKGKIVARIYKAGP